MRRIKLFAHIFVGALICCNTFAAKINIAIYALNKNHAYLGYVEARDTKYGLLLTPELHNLPPGAHGMHIHEYATCAKHGMAAGGHLDPTHSQKHLGPYGNGHLGDLPVLFVNKNGQAHTSTLAPRLKVDQIIGHSLMIHSGGDNYSDEPKKLGGGGARIACGVIKKFHPSPKS